MPGRHALGPGRSAARDRWPARDGSPDSSAAATDASKTSPSGSKEPGALGMRVALPSAMTSSAQTSSVHSAIGAASGTAYRRAPCQSASSSNHAPTACGSANVGCCAWPPTRTSTPQGAKLATRRLIRRLPRRWPARRREPGSALSSAETASWQWVLSASSDSSGPSPLRGPARVGWGRTPPPRGRPSGGCADRGQAEQDRIGLTPARAFVPPTRRRHGYAAATASARRRRGGAVRRG